MTFFLWPTRSVAQRAGLMVDASPTSNNSIPLSCEDLTNALGNPRLLRRDGATPIPQPRDRTFDG